MIHNKWFRRGLIALVALAVVAASVLWFFDVVFVRERIFRTFSPRKEKLVTELLNEKDILVMGRIPTFEPTTLGLVSKNQETVKILSRAGRTIRYQPNTNDPTGRTTLIDNNRDRFVGSGFGGEPFRFNKETVAQMGPIRVKNYATGQDILLSPDVLLKTNQSGDVLWETGVFRAWIPAPNSKDLYALLLDPTRNIRFVVRATRQDDGCSPQMTTLTRLVVEDVATAPNKEAFFDIGELASWSDADLISLIQPNDIVTAINQQHENPTTQPLGFSRRDNKAVYCADSFIVNRFGGKKQLEKELARAIQVQKITPILSRVFSLP